MQFKLVTDAGTDKGQNHVVKVNSVVCVRQNVPKRSPKVKTTSITFNHFVNWFNRIFRLKKGPREYAFKLGLLGHKMFFFI